MSTQGQDMAIRAQNAPTKTATPVRPTDSANSKAKTALSTPAPAQMSETLCNAASIITIGYVLCPSGDIPRYKVRSYRAQNGHRRGA